MLNLMCVLNFINENSIALLTLFITSITLLYMWRLKRMEDLSVLRSLFQHLEYIQNTGTSQFNQLKAYEIPPSWTLITFDLNFYLPRISHKMRAECGFRTIYTREVKQEIIKIADVVNKINNLFSLIYNSEVFNQHKNKNEYMNELIKKPYYDELNKYTTNTLNNLKKILKPI